MSNAKHETLAEIVADMRELAADMDELRPRKKAGDEEK